MAERTRPDPTGGPLMAPLLTPTPSIRPEVQALLDRIAARADHVGPVQLSLLELLADHAEGRLGEGRS